MSIKALHNESDLLHKIAEGDEFAFKLVYERYHQVIYAFARYLLKSDELAQEVLQESMLHLWQLGNDLKAITNLGAYLKTIAQRRSIDLLRRKQLYQKTEKELGYSWKETHNETEETILLNETRKILEDGILLLPPQQRLVYKLCQQQGLKYEAAAAQLNIAPGTVQTHMKHALKFLRNYLRKHSDLAILILIFKLF